MSGSTSGTSLGACGTLGVSPRLIPPHLFGKPYTNSPPSSIVTWQYERSMDITSSAASSTWRSVIKSSQGIPPPSLRTATATHPPWRGALRPSLPSPQLSFYSGRHIHQQQQQQQLRSFYDPYLPFHCHCTANWRDFQVPNFTSRGSWTWLACEFH